MKREEKVKNRSVQYWKINGWATASSLPHHNNIFVLVRLCVVFFLLSKRNNNDPSAKWSKYISWPRTCVWLVKAYIQKDYVISRFTTRWSIPTHTYEKKHCTRSLCTCKYRRRTTNTMKPIIIDHYGYFIISCTGILYFTVLNYKKTLFFRTVSRSSLSKENNY